MRLPTLKERLRYHLFGNQRPLSRRELIAAILVFLCIPGACVVFLVCLLTGGRQ